MKLRRRGKITITLFILILLVAGGAFLTLISFSAEPPVESIERCSQVLSKAREAEAGDYAGDLMAEAEASWQEAMEEWKVQNEKWFLARDYTLLHAKITQALQRGEEAYRRSIAVKDSLHHDLAVELREVDQYLKNYTERYGLLPLSRQVRQDYQAAEMLFLEAKGAYERGNYTRVGPRLEKSRELINQSIRKNQEILAAYFTNIPKWRRWVDETIAWSKANGKAVIIVDKFARKCSIYARGVEIRSLDAEFGVNWMGEKRQVGDRATPEGKYFVTKKKSNKKTGYYKALLINYPNEEDKARFAEQKKRGMIPQKTGIGGLIEIHGGGGKGINWTDGCVAVSNDDMDQLFRWAEVGTPVTIVGSLQPLEEIQTSEQ